jgi:hypothetical protein
MKVHQHWALHAAAASEWEMGEKIGKKQGLKFYGLGFRVQPVSSTAQP